MRITWMSFNPIQTLRSLFFFFSARMIKAFQIKMDINSLCCNITQVTIYYFIFIITKIDIDRFVPKSFPKTRRVIAIVAMKENYFDTIVYDNRVSKDSKRNL